MGAEGPQGPNLALTNARFMCVLDALRVCLCVDVFQCEYFFLIL